MTPGPHLPKTYRPAATRIVASVAANCLVAVIVVGWIALPAKSKADFDWYQRITLISVFASFLVVLWGVGRCKLVAEDTGLTVTNIFSTRRYDWAQAVALEFGGSAPWAVLDLSDGTSTNVMALQAVDGNRASRSARELAGIIAAKTRADRND